MRTMSVRGSRAAPHIACARAGRAAINAPTAMKRPFETTHDAVEPQRMRRSYTK